MGIRDEEIKRLIHYAKGLGVNVILHDRDDKDNAALWHTDGSTIEVFAPQNKPKIDIVLDLLHELGHMAWFIHEKDRQPDLKFEEALGRPEDSTPKDLRKKIYDVELAGTAYWDAIYKETNLKIAKWKVDSQMEFDMWMFERYYETGKFPKGKEKKEKLKEIKSRLQPK